MVDDFTCYERAYGCAQTVGHKHKQALCRCSYLRVTLLIHKQAARYIEEVECHAINDARQDEQNHAWESRIAKSEESEAAHPCKHGNEHNHLDAVTLQEEWNEQNAQCFSHLRERNEQCSIVGSKRIGIFGYALEAGDERCGITIGYLQRHAQQAREYEEHSHTAILKQLKGI